MRAIFSDNGCISSLDTGLFHVPFRAEEGPRLEIRETDKCRPIPVKKSGASFTGSLDGIYAEMSFFPKEESFAIHIAVENRTEKVFAPCALQLRLGIDCYMENAETWNDKMFPTLMRCEKTHFFGYFMSPAGNTLAIASPDPIACYEHVFTRIGNGDYGHRIDTEILSLLHEAPLPARHPDHAAQLNPGEKRSYTIYLIPLKQPEDLSHTVSEICGIPMIESASYTLDAGQTPEYCVRSQTAFTETWTDPEGHPVTGWETPGVYTLTVKTADGKQSEAKFYCHRPWGWYLKAARLAVLHRPQKPTTNCESWYGFFPAMLAARYDPDPDTDRMLLAHYKEVIPLMFDMEKANPKIIPNRIQNVSTFISLLTDKYQLEKDPADLDLACRYADWLIEKQGEDGAFRNGKTHYTCVIYIAKSILELYEAEKEAGRDADAERHYQSVHRAVDELVCKLDHIETEGEQTFEDGMISCSALQIGMFALTLPLNERKPYISAAEHMMKMHRCLEQLEIPDCRMRGASLRFWEAQYDVLYRPNMFNSPHGWSAWTAYGKYYLFLLTGKEKYLQELYNLMGACVQLIHDGNLKWAFVPDPFVNADVFVPDYTKPVEDGFRHFVPQEPAYRGKWEKKVIGETYVDTISQWYRPNRPEMTGGYWGCPLILPDQVIDVDSQGGCCDGDVYEIFKALEETLLCKAFVAEREDGSFGAYNCRVNADGQILHITADDDVRTVYFSSRHAYQTECSCEILCVPAN